MAEEHRIDLVDDPDDSAVSAIGRGIDDYNEQQAGKYNHKRLCLLLHAPDRTIVGGLIGATCWSWFYISLLWVAEELRGRGYGHRLLTLAEEEARQRGGKNAYLDTFSFQAPDFYKQHGYDVFGELPDFPQGSHRYFLKKQL